MALAIACAGVWVVASVGNAQAQAQPKAEAKAPAAKSATSENAKKAAKPARVPTRKEFVELPGAPRTPLDGFRGKTRQLPFEKPTDDQLDSVYRKRVDRLAIDAVAKSKVYALTSPNDELNIGKNVEEVLKPCRDARDQEDFCKVYKSAAIKYAKDLLSNSLVVQINAVLLISRLFDGTGDVKDGVPILVNVLKEGKSEDAVTYLALRGLQQAKQFKQLDVPPEREAVTAILAAANRPGVQPVLFEEMVVTLGAMGLAYTGDLPERADVAVFLGRIVLDKSRDLRLRYEAANSFGHLNFTSMTGPNAELIGIVMAQFVVDLAAAHKDNKVPEETYRYWMYNLARGCQTQNRNSGNARLKELAGIMGEFATTVIGKQEADVSGISAWLAASTVKVPKIAPSSEALPLPAGK